MPPKDIPIEEDDVAGTNTATDQNLPAAATRIKSGGGYNEVQIYKGLFYSINLL